MTFSYGRLEAREVLNKGVYCGPEGYNRDDHSTISDTFMGFLNLTASKVGSFRTSIHLNLASVICGITGTRGFSTDNRRVRE